MEQKDAVIVVNKLGEVLLFNHSAERLFDIHWRDIVGQSLDLILPPEYKEKHKRYIKDFFAGQGRNIVGTTVELDTVKSDGSHLPIELSLSLIDKDEGMLMAVIRDISEKKKYLAELEQYRDHLEEMVDKRTREIEELHQKILVKEKLAAIGEAMSVVAHDLRGPLCTISQIAYLLKVTNAVNKEYSSYVDDLKREFHKAMNVIESMNDFLHNRHPTTRLYKLKKIVSLALNNVSTSQSEIVTNQVAEDLWVLCDQLQMERVLWNLLKNAFEELENIDNPQVIITSELSGKFVNLIIADNAGGISPENLAKLFTPLFTTKSKGTGLGLVSCRNLVEKMGGKIVLESKLGEGTRVIVSLLRGGGDKVEEDTDS